MSSWPTARSAIFRTNRPILKGTTKRKAPVWPKEPAKCSLPAPSECLRNFRLKRGNQIDFQASREQCRGYQVSGFLSSRCDHCVNSVREVCGGGPQSRTRHLSLDRYLQRL